MILWRTNFWSGNLRKVLSRLETCFLTACIILKTILEKCIFFLGEPPLLLLLCHDFINFILRLLLANTAEKMKFSIKKFFSKCDQIRNFLLIWSHLRKKSSMENFILCAVEETLIHKVDLKANPHKRLDRRITVHVKLSSVTLK